MKGGLIPDKIRVLGERINGCFKEKSLNSGYPAAAFFFADPTGKMFVDGLIVVTVISLIRELKHHNKPVKVLGVKSLGDGKIRVDLENRSLKPFYVKPSLRLVRFPTKKEKTEASEIPMLAASSSPQDKVYDLIGESESSTRINPSEITQVTLDCSPHQCQGLNAVSVSVEYGDCQDNLGHYMERDFTVQSPKEHPYLRHVGEKRGFILKKDHHEILDEVYMLEGLLKAVKDAPDESIKFHMTGGNDFASWVRDVIGDFKLWETLSEIKLSKPEETRQRLADAMQRRMLDLEKQEFFGKHPNLNYVGQAYAFKLKTNHDNIIGEAGFLHELRDALRSSPTDVVLYHMKDGRNDFADWAREVLGDETLEEALRAVELISPYKTQELLAKVIDYRINELEQGSYST